MNKFPDDKMITVIRPNRTTFRVKQSKHLMEVHKFTASEVRATQLQEKKRNEFSL